MVLGRRDVLVEGVNEHRRAAHGSIRVGEAHASGRRGGEEARLGDRLDRVDAGDRHLPPEGCDHGRVGERCHQRRKPGSAERPAVGGEVNDDLAVGKPRAQVQRSTPCEGLRAQAFDTHGIAPEERERPVARARVNREHLVRRRARLRQDALEHAAQVGGLVPAADDDRDGGCRHAAGGRCIRSRSQRRARKAGWR